MKKPLGSFAAICLCMLTLWGCKSKIFPTGQSVEKSVQYLNTIPKGCNLGYPEAAMKKSLFSQLDEDQVIITTNGNTPTLSVHLIYFSDYYGPKAESGNLFFLEKKKNVWTITNSMMIWIS